MTRLGIPDDLLEEIQAGETPSHPLERDTSLYADLYVSMRIFHMLYTEYMARTTSLERAAYRLFLFLEAKKTEHRRDKEQAFEEASRQAHDAVPVMSAGRTRP